MTALATLISQVLVALTIEMDNAHEERMLKTWARPFKTSFVMWSNFLRYVEGSGTSVENLVSRSCTSRSVTGSVIGGMERWGYVAVGENPAGGFVSRRKGFGTASGLKPGTVIFPSQVGTIAADLWTRLPDEIEQRWRERLGDRRVDDLRSALTAMQSSSDTALPRFMPVVAGKGLFAAASVADGVDAPDEQLPALLSRVLLRFTLQAEEGAAVSWAIGANVLRGVDAVPVAVSDLPAMACVSKEAVAVSLTWLQREGHVVVDPDPRGRGKRATLTAAGHDAQLELARPRDRVDGVDADAAASLRGSLDPLLDDPAFAAGLITPPGGWRGTGRYKPLTETFIRSPRDGLPHHPMVLHRGGWPDGS